jgi:FtsH-binding integral membrane protein
MEKRHIVNRIAWNVAVVVVVVGVLLAAIFVWLIAVDRYELSKMRTPLTLPSK